MPSNNPESTTKECPCIGEHPSCSCPCHGQVSSDEQKPTLEQLQKEQAELYHPGHECTGVCSHFVVLPTPPTKGFAEVVEDALHTFGIATAKTVSAGPPVPPDAAERHTEPALATITRAHESDKAAAIREARKDELRLARNAMEPSAEVPYVPLFDLYTSNRLAEIEEQK